VANEYRIYNTWEEVVADPEGLLRLYTVWAEAVQDPVDSIRIHTTWAEAVHNPEDLLRLYTLFMEGVHNPEDDVEVHTIWFEGVFSNDWLGQPAFYEADEIFGVAFHANDLPDGGVDPKFALREMERNPYRPHIAEDEELRWKDYREQQRVIRQQHNITQAGDSTFDYGLLLKAYPNQEFTLGSLGRFFHDEYGLILARFVKFKDCVTLPFQGQPVGRLKFNTESVTWVVTNNIEKSDPELIFGFTFFAETPPDDYYGWAVVSGPNPAQIQLSTYVDPLEQDDYLSWSASGIVIRNGTGRICGRLWGKPAATDLSAGTVFIGLEGKTDLDLIDTVRGALDELANIDSILDRVEQVESSLSALQTLVATQGTNLTTIDAKYLMITNSLSSQISVLTGMIGSSTDWTAYINAKILELKTAYETKDLELLALILAAQARADAAFALASAFDLTSLQGILDTINAQIGILYDRPYGTQVWMPVVDGSIPPTFIQNPDGSLIYVRIE